MSAESKALARDRAKATIGRCDSMVINCPWVFKEPAFKAWLNNGQPKMTWYGGGDPNEWSDVVVLVDPGLGGEGVDSDMPEEIWEWIVSCCREHLRPKAGTHHVMVRLTNIEVDG